MESFHTILKKQALLYPYPYYLLIQIG